MNIADQIGPTQAKRGCWRVAAPKGLKACVEMEWAPFGWAVCRDPKLYLGQQRRIGVPNQAGPAGSSLERAFYLFLELSRAANSLSVALHPVPGRKTVDRKT